MFDVGVQRRERPFSRRAHEAVPYRVGVDVVDLPLHLGLVVQWPFVELAPEPRPAENPLEESLDEAPPRSTGRVARRQREDAMQVIGQDHARGQREWIAVVARPERVPERIRVLGQRARAPAIERRGEEVLAGCGVAAAIGIHPRTVARRWRCNMQLSADADDRDGGRAAYPGLAPFDFAQDRLRQAQDRLRESRDLGIALRAQRGLYGRRTDVISARRL